MTDASEFDTIPGQEAEPAPPAADNGTGVIRADEAIPTRLIALPLNQRPVFPTMLLPLVIPAGRLAESMRRAISGHHGWVGFFLTREALEDGASYKAADLHLMGCAGRIVKHQDPGDGGLQVLVQIATRWLVATVESDAETVVVRGAPVRTPVDAMEAPVRAMAMAIVG